MRQRRGWFNGYLGFEWWRFRLSSPEQQEACWEEHDVRMAEKYEQDSKNTDRISRISPFIGQAEAQCREQEPPEAMIPVTTTNATDESRSMRYLNIMIVEEGEESGNPDETTTEAEPSVHPVELTPAIEQRAERKEKPLSNLEGRWGDLEETSKLQSGSDTDLGTKDSKTAETGVAVSTCSRQAPSGDDKAKSLQKIPKKTSKKEREKRDRELKQARIMANWEYTYKVEDDWSIQFLLRCFRFIRLRVLKMHNEEELNERGSGQVELRPLSKEQRELLHYVGLDGTLTSLGLVTIL